MNNSKVEIMVRYLAGLREHVNSGQKGWMRGRLLRTDDREVMLDITPLEYEALKKEIRRVASWLSNHTGVEDHLHIQKEAIPYKDLMKEWDATLGQLKSWKAKRWIYGPPGYVWKDQKRPVLKKGRTHVSVNTEPQRPRKERLHDFLTGWMR